MRDLALIFAGLLLITSTSLEAQQFIRGDANGDGVVDVSDPIFTAEALFGGGPSLCHDAEDANDDGLVDLADPVYLFYFLFDGASAPAAPTIECGEDPTPDALGCDTPSLICNPPSGLPPLFPGEVFLTGNGVRTLIAADFNGDGAADLASLASNDNGVSVVLNPELDSIQEPTFSPVGFSLRDLAVGDLDEDGALDLIIGRSSELRVLPGNGDGTFEPATTVAMNISADGVIVADTVGDPALDLTAIRVGSVGQVRTFPGIGDGTFAPAIFSSVPDITDAGLDWALVDGDAEVDLALTISGSTTVLPGSGGSYDSTIPIALPGSGEFPVLIDLDFDGNSDVVSVTPGPEIAFHRNLGGGAFDVPVTTPLGSLADLLLLRDMNLDGHEDAIVANSADDTVTVLLGDSAGSFVESSTYRSSNFPRAMATLDWDRDGIPDLASAGGGPYGAIHRGRGDGTFETPSRFPVTGLPEEVVTGDWNGDGELDFAVLCPSDNALRLFEGDGQGNFTLMTVLSFSGIREALRTGDFNADGIPDFAVFSVVAGEVEVLSSDAGTGNYSSQFLTTGGFPLDMEVADVNDDSHLDLIVGTSVGQVIRVALGQGNSQFGLFSIIPAGAQVRSIAIGDVTGDDVLDIVATLQSGSIVVRIGDGTGDFTAGSAFSVIGVGIDIGLADVDADGDLDIFTGVTDDDDHSSLQIFLNDGSGIFSAGDVFPTSGSVFGGLGGIDINLDGILDLVAHVTDEGLAVFLGQGNGEFAPRRSFYVGSPFSVTSCRIVSFAVGGTP